MTWQLWLTFFRAAIVIAVSPGAGAIQSMATGLFATAAFVLAFLRRGPAAA